MNPEAEMREAAIAMRGWQDREYRYIPEGRALAILGAVLRAQRLDVLDRLIERSKAYHNNTNHLADYGPWEVCPHPWCREDRLAMAGPASKELG